MLPRENLFQRAHLALPLVALSPAIDVTRLSEAMLERTISLGVNL